MDENVFISLDPMLSSVNSEFAQQILKRKIFFYEINMNFTSVVEQLCDLLLLLLYAGLCNPHYKLQLFMFP